MQISKQIKTKSLSPKIFSRSKTRHEITSGMSFHIVLFVSMKNFILNLVCGVDLSPNWRLLHTIKFIILKSKNYSAKVVLGFVVLHLERRRN